MKAFRILDCISLLIMLLGISCQQKMREKDNKLTGLEVFYLNQNSWKEVQKEFVIIEKHADSSRVIELASQMLRDIEFAYVGTKADTNFTQYFRSIKLPESVIDAAYKDAKKLLSDIVANNIDTRKGCNGYENYYCWKGLYIKYKSAVLHKDSWFITFSYYLPKEIALEINLNNEIFFHPYDPKYQSIIGFNNEDYFQFSYFTQLSKLISNVNEHSRYYGILKEKENILLFW